MPGSVLIIEDEETMVEGLTYQLKKEGFQVSSAMDGEAGLAMARRLQPDLVVLDLMLPKLDGLQVCRSIRQESDMPVIMVTAKGTDIDRVVGLELGADDYVVKPFSVRELVARIRAVLRRSGDGRGVRTSHFTYRDLEIDFDKHEVKIRGKRVDLAPRQYHLLRALALGQGKVLGRDELLKVVWGQENLVDTHTVDVHIRWLREKLEENPARPTLITTVRGAGYRLGD